MQGQIIKQYQEHFAGSGVKLNSDIPFIVQQIKHSKVLLVGEGNMSFALSLITDHNINPNDLVVSIYEKESELDDFGKINQSKLTAKQVSICYGVDAKKLEKHFENSEFDFIVFQFPHTGTRDAIKQRNSNDVLIEDFLKSTKPILKPNGKVLITTVNSDYYNRMFSIHDNAQDTGFLVAFVVPFRRSDYPSYQHENTHDDSSSLKNYRNLVTWVLSKKEGVPYLC